jgi:hypothetical protein
MIEQYNFRRFFYWLSEAEFFRLKNSSGKERPRPMPIISLPCKIIHPMVAFAYLAPEEWNRVCRRQGSWYRSSSKNGHYLILSRKSVPGLIHRLSGVIMTSSFKPSRWADKKDINQLKAQMSYIRSEPQAWRKILKEEKRHWQNLLSRFNVTKDLESLIDAHSANHANFIKPLFYIKEDGRTVPYSIERSVYVCSSCVEMFNILGERFEKKYIMPCPGCVVYAQQEANQFLKVISGLPALAMAGSS